MTSISTLNNNSSSSSKSSKRYQDGNSVMKLLKCRFCTISYLALMMAFLFLFQFSMSGNFDFDNTRRQASEVATQYLKQRNQQQQQQQQRSVQQQQQQPQKPPVIDIMSIGSQARPDYLDAQERTFGSHPTVRHFFRIDERDDTDQDCPSTLTLDQVHHILEFCKTSPDTFQNYPTMQLWRKLYTNPGFLLGKPNPPGWVCAQTRPIDGLVKVLKEYTDDNKGGVALPDYLLVGDDDSYFNMPVLVPALERMYPSSKPVVSTGCLVEAIGLNGYTFPYGGWGTVFTKRALENLIQPLYCKNTNNSQNNKFVQLACEQLERNEVGEQDRFQEGMSVADLMQSYATGHSFRNIDTSWKGTTGYCMHSDVALSYFINLYHIPMDSNTDEFFTDIDRQANVTQQMLQGLTLYRDINDDIRKQYTTDASTSTGQLPIVGPNKQGGNPECSNGLYENKCSLESSTICHYMKPDGMERLHAEAVMKAQEEQQLQHQEPANSNH